MAKPTNKTTTIHTEPTQREHISTAPAVRQSFRGWQMMGDPCKALEVATGYRVELEDMILPHHLVLAKLSADEQVEYRRRNRLEIMGEEKALTILRQREESGYNSTTRASEIAAAAAQHVANAEALVARTVAYAEQIEARQEADRLADIQRRAAAMARGAQ